MIRTLAIFALVACVFAKPYADLDGRIIGGNKVSIETYPYQISLRVSGDHYCGGSIISADFVLTGAHCLIEESNSEYEVQAGSSNRLSGGSLHSVKKIIPHKEYYVTKYGEYVNDIALLQVWPPFKLDKTRAVIPLFEGVTKAGSIATISGWGDTESEKSPTSLKAVNIPIISKDECKKAYKILSAGLKGQICAALPEGGKDSCQGDSGGPLAIGGKLAGVVSWGLGCAEKGHPGVYTEVAHHLAWIRKYVSL